MGPLQTAPTERYARHYNMNHSKRGLAIIFNHEFFTITHLKPRCGTNIDCENLVTTLKNLGFEVNDFHNSTHRDIVKNLERGTQWMFYPFIILNFLFNYDKNIPLSFKFQHISEDSLNIFPKNIYFGFTVANMDHSQHDCLVVAVLSHGELGLLYAHDTSYKSDSIWGHFTADKCPTLAGKPKLFFIQACQGDRLDSGVTMKDRTETDGQPTSSFRIPTHADFLVAYSTIPGICCLKLSLIKI